MVFEGRASSTSPPQIPDKNLGPRMGSPQGCHNAVQRMGGQALWRTLILSERTFPLAPLA